MHFSDDEFWSSTPRKIFGLLEYHIKYEKSRTEIPEGAGQGIGSGSRIPKVSNNRVKKMGIEDFVKMGGGVIKK